MLSHNNDVLEVKLRERSEKLDSIGWDGASALEVFRKKVEQKQDWDQDTRNLVLIDALDLFIKIKEQHPDWGETDLYIRLALQEIEIKQDHLTGIFNRQAFDKALDSQFLYPSALVILDLNGFKNINDQLGHAAGDAALKHFVDTVKTVIRDSDGFYRTGGDEFTFILPDQDEKGAMDLMKRVREELANNPFVWEDQDIELYTSAGVAAVGRDTVPSECYSKADERMYEDKKVQPKSLAPSVL